ncbi:hypothetical protein IPJ91_00330 [bacterium]|nr:MAG: hypothetical protein IPJ91_00330 [bacterium]
MSLFQNLQNTLEQARKPVSEVYGYRILEALNHFASKNDGVSFRIGDKYEVQESEESIEITLPQGFTKADLLQAVKDIRHRVDSKIIDDIAAKYIRVGKYLSENADDAKFLLKNGRKFRSFDSREEVLALSKSVIEFGLALVGS